MAQLLENGQAAREANLDYELPSLPEPVFAKMAVRGGSITKSNQPVHETMTLAALIGSHFGHNPDTTWKNSTDEDNEFIRGVVWNDDPAGLLFDDYDYDNYVLSTALEWATAYKAAEKNGILGNIASLLSPSDPMKNITGRSHFGDLQFLHGMASREGEPPMETKGKIMMWLEIVYRLALGNQGIIPDTRLQDVVTSGPFQLRSFFNDNTVPPGTATLRLLLGNDGKNKVTKYLGYNVQYRALGSCFHVIQDGYAYGHIRRRLLNENDCVDRAHVKMRDGIADHWGEVQNFHTYKGQSSDHAKYDHGDINIENMTTLGNRDQFNGMAGVRDGIEQCITLANFWHTGTPWEGDNNVEQWFRDIVFQLSEDASPANHEV